jgi:chemotaxis protein MotB
MNRRGKQRDYFGGAWKVAYADFTTAMMALFICLWLTAQDTRIKDAVERAFRNPFAAVNKESTGIIPRETVTSSNSRREGIFDTSSVIEMEMLRHISEDLARILEDVDEDQKTVRVELTPEGLRINVFDRAQKPVFERDSDAFTSYGSWVFSTLAWEIARYHTFQIELEGHTAAGGAPAGPNARGQWEISADRANAARRLLIQSGVVPAQVFKVSGYADTQPMKGLPPSDEINRRVTVLLRLGPVRPEQTQASNAHFP